MALMKCEECGKTVSEKAESCPNCGAMISLMDLDAAKAQGALKLKTDEQITKKVKLQSRLSNGIGVIGFFVMFSGNDIIGFLLIAITIIWWNILWWKYGKRPFT